MPHARTQLRAAVKSALAGLAPTVGGTRAQPWNIDQLPAIEVTTPDERAEPLNVAIPTTLERTVDLQIVVHVARDDGDLEDEADDIAAAIEAAIAGSATVAAAVARLNLVGSSFDPGDGGERPTARVMLNYEAVQHTQADAPGVLV